MNRNDDAAPVLVSPDHPHLATLDEIRGDDYNRETPRDLDISEDEAAVDCPETEPAAARAPMAQSFVEFGSVGLMAVRQEGGDR